MADHLIELRNIKKRYGSVEALNKALATQRWSRRIGSWDEVRRPYADCPGPAEPRTWP